MIVLFNQRIGIYEDTTTKKKPGAILLVVTVSGDHVVPESEGLWVWHCERCVCVVCVCVCIERERDRDRDRERF